MKQLNLKKVSGVCLLIGSIVYEPWLIIGCFLTIALLGLLFLIVGSCSCDRLGASEYDLLALGYKKTLEWFRM